MPIFRPTRLLPTLHCPEYCSCLRLSTEQPYQHQHSFYGLTPPQRISDERYPVIGWTHGVSGVYRECGPSHIRNLRFDWSAPFPLALSGYVVVAPDYAGLGVNKSFDGSPITSEFLANPAEWKDVIYAVEATQKAFSSLSDQFIVMGQSQGGGAAWGAAEVLAEQPVPGYLGTIAASPLTFFIETFASNPDEAYLSAPLLAWSLTQFFPGFQPSEFLTDEGIKRFDLATQLQACNSGIGELFRDPGLVRTDWLDNVYARLYQNLTFNGLKNIAGPLLVLQGEADSSVPYEVTSRVVNETCSAFPDSDIEYWHFEDVQHVPVLHASQWMYMQWIADRFAGKSTQGHCSEVDFRSTLPYSTYNPNINWFLEFATAPYETA